MVDEAVEDALLGVGPAERLTQTWRDVVVDVDVGLEGLLVPVGRLAVADQVVGVLGRIRGAGRGRGGLDQLGDLGLGCLLYTSPSPRDS